MNEPREEPESFWKNNYDQLSHIIFDAYGTLLSPSRYNIWQELGKRAKATREEVWRALAASDDLQEILDKMAIPKASQKEFIEKVRDDIAQIQPHPDAIPLLKYLKERKYSLAIDSFLIPLYAGPIKEHFSDYVEKFVFSFEQQHMKGESQHYSDLLQSLNISAHQALFVGDHYRRDYLASKAAGMNALHLSNKWGKVGKEKLTTLNELLTVLNI